MKKVNLNFIPQNVAPIGAKQLTIFDSDDNLVTTLPLGRLANKPQGDKLYSFGALSDVHLPYAAQNASTDFQKALTYFNNVANVDFICISGDMSDKGTDAEWLDYKNHVDTYSPNTPVHISAGNHDVANGDMSYDYPVQYTGNPLWYSFEQNNDVFIMFGLRQWQGDNVFHNEALQWLYETLEENKDKRCFVFQHEMRLDGCGNAHGLYGWDGLSGRNGQIFLSLMEHYKNVIWFHGHSHTPFRLQSVQPTPIANYDRLHGCHSVHIPSLAIPRYGNSDVIFDAEGYIVDIYENGIHLRGIDFIEEEFVPIASYWIDTTPVEIPAKSYTDKTGTITTTKAITLPEGAELVLNKRFSNSEKKLVTATGMFAAIIPVGDMTDSCTVKIKNSSIALNVKTNPSSVLYALDSNKGSSILINGGHISDMTEGVIFSEDYKSADITFTLLDSYPYICLSLYVTNESITEADIKEYVIEIEEINTLTQGEITNEVTWTMDKRLSSIGDPDKDDKGTMASDYISVTPGDVINIYGISSLDNRYLMINLYNDGTFMYNIPLSNANMNPTDSNYAYAEYDTATLRLTVQIKDTLSINSIRVCCVASSVTVYRNAELVLEPIVLPEGSELYLNQRFSQSGKGLQAVNGNFAVIMPIDGTKAYTLSISDMPISIFNISGATLYALDETKTIGNTLNGASNIFQMTTGVTASEDYKSAIIHIPAGDATVHYLAFTATIASTSVELTEEALNNIVINLATVDTSNLFNL